MQSARSRGSTANSCKCSRRVIRVTAASAHADDGVPGEIRMAFVGSQLAQHLQNAGVDLQQYGVTTLTTFDDLAEATAPNGNESGERRASLDALLVSVDSLQEDVATQIIALGGAVRAKAIAVVYGFGTGPAAEILRAAGVRLHREAESRTEFRQMLADLCERVHLQERSGDDVVWSRVGRRYDDGELEVMATRSSTIACECPRHLVELVHEAVGIRAL